MISMELLSPSSNQSVKFSHLGMMTKVHNNQWRVHIANESPLKDIKFNDTDISTRLDISSKGKEEVSK